MDKNSETLQRFGECIDITRLNNWVSGEWKLRLIEDILDSDLSDLQRIVTIRRVVTTHNIGKLSS